MAFNFRRILEGLYLVPKSSSTASQKGDMDVTSGDGKLNYHNGSSASPVVTEAHAATLTNKTIDADVNTIADLTVTNLKAGVLDTDLTAVSASDDTIPSAKATKAYIDSGDTTVQTNLTNHINDATDAHDASAISVSPSGDLTSTDVQSALVELQGDIDASESGLAAHIADATDAHDASAISVVATGDLTSTDVQAALVELQSDIDTDEAALATHIADQAAHGATSANTAGKIVARDGSGHIVVSTVKGNLDSAAPGGTVNIGATDATTVNIGNPGATVNIQGTVHVVDVTNLTVTDSLITLNDGGGAATGGGAGIEVEEAAVITGYTKVAADRNGWEFKAPNTNGVATVVPGASNDEVALLAKAQTLTNKTIDADNNTITDLTVTNLKAGVLDTDLTGVSASDDTIPSAKATKTYADAILATHEADTSTHGVTGAIVGTSDTQTLSNKSFSDAVNLPELGATPSNPSAGSQKVYMKTDGKFYKLTSGGVETEVGAGGAGAGDLDTILSQSFDSSNTAGFTQTGLEFVTSLSMHGDQSARLVHQSGSTYSFKQTIDIEPKFRGYNTSLSLLVRSSATTGNVTLLVTDETNSEALLSSTQIDTDSSSFSGTTTNASASVTGISNTDINLLQVGMTVTGSGIPTGTVISAVGTSSITLSQNATASATVTIRYSSLPVQRNFSFFIPEDCESLSYTISALAETGSPETYIDDVVIKKGLVSYSQTSASVDVPVVTEPETWTPTGSWSTNTTYTGKKWRVGDRGYYEVYISLAGAPTSAALTINMPSGEVIDTTKLGSGSAVGAQTQVLGGGKGFAGDTGNATYQLWAVYNSTTAIAVRSGNAGGSALADNGVSQSSPFTFGSTDTVMIAWDAPIVGWDSHEQRSLSFSSPVSVGQALLNSTEIEVPVIGEWQSYTPTVSGMTLTTSALRWRQVGDSIEIEGTITPASVAASEARLYFPNGYVASSSYVSQTVVGQMLRGIANTNIFFALSTTAGSQYVVFGGHMVSGGNSPIVATNGSSIMGAAEVEQISIRVKVDALSVTETKTVPLTSSVLVEEADSVVRLYTANGYGSTNTKIRRFSGLADNRGSDISYSDTSTLGSAFTINTSGIYHITYVDNFSAITTIGISKNSTQLTTNVYSITSTDVLAMASTSGLDHSETVSWTGYLAAGDVIRPHTDGTASNTATHAYFTIARIGNLKQVNVSTDQKVEIPTHEVRLEGCTAVGGTATAIAKFNNLTKLRGDGFTVTNTTADGTYLTVTKAGILHATAALYKPGSNSLIQITKNQAVLTTISTTASEILASVQHNNTAGEGMTCTVAGVAVVPGDIIRVCTFTTPVADAGSNFTVYLQEQKVQVALSNVLPQFTEGDSCVRVNTTNGYGSTNTFIRRFSNVELNAGGAVTYADSSTLGASFTINESGIYLISFTDNQGSASAHAVGISRNAPGTTSYGSLTDPTQMLAVDTGSGTGGFDRTSASWQGYLAKGDVIRPHTNAGSSTSTAQASFTISKIGKPNITSVDVTPFVNIPYPIERSYLASLDGSMQITTVRKNTLAGEVLITNPATLQLQITAVRACTINATCSHRDSSGAAWAGTMTISYNGTQYDNLQTTGSNGAGVASGTVNLTLQPGDTVRFTAASGGGSDNGFSLVTREIPNTVVAQNSTYRISDYVSTRVTGTAPTTLGQYRSYLRNSSAQTYTETNGTPTILPSVANGLHLSTSAGWTTADASGAPSRYEVFVGRNKKVDFQFYQTTGRSGAVDVSPLVSSGARFAGTLTHYDPASGIASVCVYVDGNFTSSRIGVDPQSPSSGLSTAYFDIIVSDNPLVTASVPRARVFCSGGNGYGSTNTKIRKYTNATSSGSDLTMDNSSTLGLSVTVNTPGVYTISRSDGRGSGGTRYGLSLNSSQLTTNIDSITTTNALVMQDAGSIVNAISYTDFFPAGSIIRPHDDGLADRTAVGQTNFVMVKVSN
jgi:hypothetical protein